MWGARERMVFRKIFPALRIFSEGTWVLIRWKEGERKRVYWSKKKQPGKSLNHFPIWLWLEKYNSFIHSHCSCVWLLYVENQDTLNMYHLWERSWGCLMGCSDIWTTSSGYWWLVNPPTSHYLGNGVSRTKRNVRFNERCLKNKTLKQKKIKQKVH